MLQPVNASGISRRLSHDSDGREDGSELNALTGTTTDANFALHDHDMIDADASGSASSDEYEMGTDYGGVAYMGPRSEAKRFVVVITVVVVLLMGGVFWRSGSPGSGLQHPLTTASRTPVTIPQCPKAGQGQGYVYKGTREWSITMDKCNGSPQEAMLMHLVLTAHQLGIPVLLPQQWSFGPVGTGVHWKRPWGKNDGTPRKDLPISYRYDIPHMQETLPCVTIVEPAKGSAGLWAQALQISSRELQPLIQGIASKTADDRYKDIARVIRGQMDSVDQAHSAPGDATLPGLITLDCTLPLGTLPISASCLHHDLCVRVLQALRPSAAIQAHIHTVQEALNTRLARDRLAPGQYNSTRIPCTPAQAACAASTQQIEQCWHTELEATDYGGGKGATYPPVYIAIDNKDASAVLRNRYPSTPLISLATLSPDAHTSLPHAVQRAIDTALVAGSACHTVVTNGDANVIFDIENQRYIQGAITYQVTESKCITYS